MSGAGAVVGAMVREAGRWWWRLPWGWKAGLEGVDWVLAVVWCVRTRTLMNRLGEVPDLSEVRWDLGPVGAPGVMIVVPAKDEAETVGPAMETLLAQDYPWLRIAAVDDRSTDRTGAILEEMAGVRPDRLGVVHLSEVAEGWIGKTFALEVGVARSRSEWILFTDADVWMSPSLVRRALTYAEMSRADHLVVVPSLVVRGWGERVMVGFLSVFGLWLCRPWRVSDPKAPWDAMGVGAFNLIRREALEEMGGLAPQRLAVVEDYALGRRVRAAGMRQRMVFAPGLVLVRWATGMGGIVRGMTKNAFAAMGFHLWAAAVFCGFAGIVFLLPLLGLVWWRTVLPSVIALACVAVHYRAMAEVTGVEARWGWMYPLGAGAVVWAMVRSVAVTLWRGGVRWRETFYSLRALRPWNGLLLWEMEAARMRAERRRVERGIRPGRWMRWVGRL